jgi:dCTP deaminase
MILSAREIRVLLERGLIGLVPMPEDPRRWSPTSVDLTLDGELRPWGGMVPKGLVIDPTEEGFRVNRLVQDYTEPTDCTGGYVLMPNTLVLGWTVEHLSLPRTARIGARVEGKSSLARVGLGIHVTAPTIHPGFGHDEANPGLKGSSIRLEIWNAGPLQIRLTKGMPICQLLFEEVHGTPEAGYVGQFRVQGPASLKPARTQGRRKKRK